MATVPQVSCPRCRAAAEYQVTVEIPDPPVGKIDVGHCADCACLFEFVRETATAYDSTSWLPVCRQCKQPVMVVSVAASADDTRVDYVCRDHPLERWQHRRAADTWHRTGAPA